MKQREGLKKFRRKINNLEKSSSKYFTPGVPEADFGEAQK